MRPHMTPFYRCRRTRMLNESFQQIINNVYKEIANHPAVANAAPVRLAGHNLRAVQRATKHLKEGGDITGVKKDARME